jgi:ferredoxin
MMTVMSETFRVTLQPGGETFTAAADQTLLLASLAAGIALPWSCRTGTCRTCIARLEGGRVEHRIPWPGLSAEEKAEGFILPCVAEPRSDCTLRSGSA